MQQVQKTTQVTYIRKTRETAQKQTSDNKAKINTTNTKKYSREEIAISRGRKNFKMNVQTTKYYKSSHYRASKSSSRVKITRKNRAQQRNGYYSSNEITDITSEEAKVYYNSTATKNSHNTKKEGNIGKMTSKENTSQSKSSSLKKYKKSTCSCCKCNIEASDNEENKLPEEIYQILWEVYEGNINRKNIVDLVRRYHISVSEFCAKEEQQEVVYLVKTFSEKVNEALSVS